MSAKFSVSTIYFGRPPAKTSCDAAAKMSGADASKPSDRADFANKPRREVTKLVTRSESNSPRTFKLLVFMIKLLPNALR